MAEKNYLSSSQESLPLSEDSYMYLLNQLGSPLSNLINEVTSTAVIDQNYPAVMETVATPSNQDYRILDEVGNLCHTVPLNKLELQYLNNNPQEQKKTPSSLPATENWPGDFHFNVTFKLQENVKGAQYIYSGLKNKLYVRKDVTCPINFSTNTVMTDDVIIRAMALFSSADQALNIVKRCINHSMAEIDKNLPEAEHLIRCESSSAVYVNDPITGRDSVVVPFENPPAGQQFSAYIFKFVCFGSCPGGPNRRPLMLVFTLEKGGYVIGRQKVDLKICACPSRDMKADEKQLNPDSTNNKSEKGMKRKNPDVVNDTPKQINLFGVTPDTIKPEPVPNYHSAVKRIRPASEKKGPYSIMVEDEKCYYFLKMMKRCFRLLYNSSNVNQSSRNNEFINLIRNTFSSSSSEDER